MNVKSIVVEQLDWGGTSKSLTLEPDHRGQLWVAFPTDYDEPRTGPFYFQHPDYQEHFDSGFAECRERRITKTNFFDTNGIFTYKTSWQGIPTENMSISYYALYLPEFAVPTKINVYPFGGEKQSPRTVFKDDKVKRYIIYIQCISRFGQFTFDLECKFHSNEIGFESSSYKDEYQQDFYARPDDWKYYLTQKDMEKTQNFFADKIIFPSGNLSQKIVVNKTNNPWISGSFYLLLFIVVMTTLAVISEKINWAAIPIVFTGGVLFIGVVGALQLRNDDKLKEEGFIKLITEVYKKLPVIKLFKQK